MRKTGRPDACLVDVLYRDQHAGMFAFYLGLHERRDGVKVAVSKAHSASDPADGRKCFFDSIGTRYVVTETVHTAPAVYFTTLGYDQLSAVLKQRGYVAHVNGSWEPCITLFSPAS
jgi:hypothetical protein